MKFIIEGETLGVELVDYYDPKGILDFEAVKLTEKIPQKIKTWGDAIEYLKMCGISQAGQEGWTVIQDYYAAESIEYKGL